MSHAAALARLPLFTSIAPSDLEAFVAVTQPVSLTAGYRVFAQGGRADVALLLVEGRLEVSVEVDGEQTVLGHVTPGELVGEQALLQPDGKRLASVHAVEPSLCLLIDADLVAPMVANPAWIALQRHLLESLVQRIRETESAMHQAWRGTAAEAPRGPDREQRPDGAERRVSLRERLRGLVGVRS